eukprot:6210956-Pleurochrysis_carterae.AAC.2
MHRKAVVASSGEAVCDGCLREDCLEGSSKHDSALGRLRNRAREREKSTASRDQTRRSTA